MIFTCAACNKVLWSTRPLAPNTKLRCNAHPEAHVHEWSRRNELWECGVCAKCTTENPDPVKKITRTNTRTCGVCDSSTTTSLLVGCVRHPGGHVHEWDEHSSGKAVWWECTCGRVTNLHPDRAIREREWVLCQRSPAYRCPTHHTHQVWHSATGPRCAICGHPLDGSPVPPDPPPARTILGWQRAAHAVAVEKGFYDKRPLNFGEQIALMHCELSEAMEEWRAGHEPKEVYEKDGKSEGIPIEFADVVLRVMQWCEELGIDLEAAMVRKHAYNQTRERMHGKKA